MCEIVEETYPIARKEYECNAFVWLGQDEPTSWGMTFSEYRDFIKARKNKGMIKIGEQYTKQILKFDGELHTTRSITSIHKICSRVGAYG